MIIIKEDKNLHDSQSFKKPILLVSLLIILIMTSCQSNPSEEAKDKLIIYTSIYPLQFLTESIINDLGHVKSIYPPGVDAHTYEPTLKEMTAIAKGDVFIFLGGGMEVFSEKVAQSLESQNAHLIEIGNHRDLFSFDNDSDYDPHIWLDPLRMIEMGQIIKDELIHLNPENTHIFDQNYELLVEDLISLDEHFINTLRGASTKEIIVSHAAYQYWEERYGIKQIPISGITSTDEPSQKELVQIVKNIKEKNLKYIIFDQTGEHRLSTIIQNHTKTKKRTIHDLEVLTENDINNNENYLTIMEKNLQTLYDVTK